MAALLPLFVLVILSAADLTSSDISSPPSPAPGASSPALAPALAPALTPALAPTGPSPSSAPSPTHKPLSPPAPPRSSPAPASTPSSVPLPAPVPSPGQGLSHVQDSTAADGSDVEEGKGGLSGGQKAGISIAVIGAVALVGLAVVVYRKRQENIRRARFGYGTRRVEMI